MKRSDAIKFIEKELYGEQVNENWASRILEVIEKMGMKPPIYTIGYTESDYPGGELQPYYSYYIDGSANWESEDE